MNVTFHTISAVGIVVLLTDTYKIETRFSLKAKIVFGISVFFVGIVAHAILDYIPHCYPIESITDVFIASISIFTLMFFARKKYKFIMAFAFLGCIFPDLVDILPKMMTKMFGIGMFMHECYFPWHWKEYSGSIYMRSNCVSTINHFLLLSFNFAILWHRRIELKMMFGLWR